MSEEKHDLVKSYKNIYKRSVNDIKYYTNADVNKIRHGIKEDFSKIQQDIEELKSEYQEKIERHHKKQAAKNKKSLDNKSDQ